MSKANNSFDYNSMATVLVSFELSALHSFDYERQVMELLDDSVSTDRLFSFRHQFADAWYDLHNPDQTDTPMTVRFQTRREDFPVNLKDHRIQHVVMYFVLEDSEIAPDPVRVDHLHFHENGKPAFVGGGATTVDSVISTRRGNAASWLLMIGNQPFGEWELSLPNTSEMKDRFAAGAIRDILLVVTYSGQTPAWPV